MNKSIKITIVYKKDKKGCPRGHKVGDVFIIENGKTPAGLCGSAFNAIWPDVKKLISTQDKKYEGSVSCPDTEVLLEYQMELIDKGDDE